MQEAHPASSCNPGWGRFGGRVHHHGPRDDSTDVAKNSAPAPRTPKLHRKVENGGGDVVSLRPGVSQTQRSAVSCTMWTRLLDLSPSPRSPRSPWLDPAPEACRI